MEIEPIKRYEILIDLYKHYNDILLKGTAFIYAVISGLFVFYITNQTIPNIEVLLYLLGFIIILSGFLFYFSSNLIDNVHKEFLDVSSDLELKFMPSVKPLYYFLKINSISMVLTFILGSKCLA
ncbi:protein of unknown function [Shewanella benthica]|uniref:Uncharacterized protein n=1 Tax=Shewanella benthica TaxID=43661 RepID=A0A330M3I8_9GAMM|nr:protein of unknown function [Shewanella benthica]